MKHTSRPPHRPGSHLVVSDRSGKVISSDEARREWTGMVVHESEWEPRHPQDFVKGRKDDQVVRGARPLQDPDSQLGTQTTADTGSGQNIDLVTLDLAASKRIARLDVTVDLEDVVAMRGHLRVKHSTDGVSFTTLNDSVVSALFEGLQDNTLLTVPMAETARYVRLSIQKPDADALSWSATLTAYGSTPTTITPNDL